MNSYDHQDHLYWQSEARRRIRRENLIDEALGYAAWVVLGLAIGLVLSLA